MGARKPRAVAAKAPAAKVCPASTGKHRQAVAYRLPAGSRVATPEDLVEGVRVHCRWLGKYLFYAGLVEAVRVVGDGNGNETTAYRVRYDDGDVEDVTDIKFILCAM